MECVRKHPGAEMFWRALKAGYGSTAGVGDWRLIKHCAGGLFDDGIVALGRNYPRNIRLWRQHFGEKRVLVITSEELEDDRVDTMTTVFDLLGLPPLAESVGFDRVCPGDFARGHVHHDADGKLVNAGSCELSDQEKEIKGPTSARRSYDIPPQLVFRLREFYRESVAEVEELLGRRLQWLQ